MSIVMLFLLIVILYKSKCFIFSKQFNDNYLSREETSSIKGIFVILVFFAHVIQYVSFNNLIDKPFNIFQYKLGQLIVCMFFFYSGYGIYESFKNKGSNYISKLPKNRIIKVLLHFDIALILYFIIGLIIGKKYTILQVFLSLFGWDSLGNSNWFIFAILFCYIITYIAFKLFKNSKISTILIFILTLIYIYTIKNFKEIWWYDTIICYPIGILFSMYVKKFYSFITKNKIYYIVLPISLVALYLFHQLHTIYGHIITSTIFSIVVVLITLKFSINNKLLKWIGDNVFGIYIFQRVPMILLSHYLNLNGYVFLILTFICTILITLIYNILFKKIDSIIFSKKAGVSS